MEHTEFTGEFATGAISKNGEVVARLVSADRDFFDRTVLAVNAHEALVEACKAVLNSYGRDKYDPSVVAVKAALKKAGVTP